MGFIKEENEKQMIFTTKIVEEATEKINDGVILKRYQNPWLKGEVGIRRPGVVFRMTTEEQEEYIKCALDIHYFVEKYCKVKREDGSVGNIKLRDYQEEILDLFSNRFSILMAARQCGKTISSSIFILHFLLFNNDKNVMIIANKGDTVIEVVDKIKSIYTLLPFFLKTGIKVWNQRSITFENGCRIKTSARTKTPAVGFTIDLLYLDEFAHIPSNIIEPFYTAAYPTVSAVQNSKIIITSTPNGMNLFHKLLTDAEKPPGDPKKNNYKAMRVYWHQVPGRFVTYLRLNDHKLIEYEITKEEIYDIVDKNFENLTSYKIEYNSDLSKDVIHIVNNENCTLEDVLKLTFIDKSGREYPITSIAEVTTWKDEAIKDIGGEDAFNQEYGLRFINASKSLLKESVIEELLKSKKPYEWHELEPFESKLKFSYKDLRWVDDEEYFMLENRNKYKFLLSVDISEGLGQDHSVINIFRLGLKDLNTIEKQKDSYKTVVDFFRLEQVGIFRSNVISVAQLAELLYLLSFEFLNPDDVKIVLELNNYGNTLLSEMPNVFGGNNNYGSSVFLRYKHRVDALEEKIGLKVGENKNMLVKDYQDLMLSKSFYINNEETIREITTFVKQTTAHGNTKYGADVGHDDCVMTIVNSTSFFKKNEMSEICEDMLGALPDKEIRDYIKSCLKEVDYMEALDYSQVLNVRNKYKSRSYGFSNNPFSKGNSSGGGGGYNGSSDWMGNNRW
jgi:hypothetical protein